MLEEEEGEFKEAHWMGRPRLPQTMIPVWLPRTPVVRTDPVEARVETGEEPGEVASWVKVEMERTPDPCCKTVAVKIGLEDC